MKKTNTNHFIIIVFLTLLLGLSFSSDRGAAQEKGKKASKEKVEYIDLKISIENALNAEKENIDQLKEQLNRAQSLKKAMTTELNVYKIQLSSYGNLLLIPKTKIENLEKAWTDIDNMFIAETDVRFEINRLFKERKIEIAFPQRDLHIRSYPEETKLEKA